MNNIRALILCVFCFFFINYSVSAQSNKEEAISLEEALTTLKSIYNINFAYADENILDKKIILPETILSIDDLLTYLSTKTGLTFQKISSKTIVIRDLNYSLFEIQQLQEVIVTEYLTKGISLKDDGIISINPERFGILPGLIEPDVLQTIQALPGVQSTDERVSNLNIRGGTHDQNLILWDGIKMYQSGHFFGLISAFNPYLTKQVNVSKNGTSAMYGDGVSSIIDMSLSDDIPVNFEGGAGFNMISADAYTKIPISNKVGLQLSLRRSITDLINTPTYDSYFKRVFEDTDVINTSEASINNNEAFYFYDASTKITYKFSPKDEISFSGLYINNNLNYNEQLINNTVSESLESNLTQQNLALGIKHQRNWNNRFQTSAQVYLSNYNLFATNFDILNAQRLIQENEIYDGGLKLHVKYKLEDQIGYFGGYQFSEVGISNLEDVDNPMYRRYIKEVLRTHSLFNEIKFLSKSKKTSARIGLRTNYIEKFSEFNFEPRLSFSQKFLDGFRVELLGEIKTQSASQVIDLQNDFLGVEKRRWILANNKDIPLIKSRQVSLGIQYNKNKLTVSVEGYIKHVDDITSRSQGFQNQYQYIDAIGKYDVKGIDFLINKRFENFSTWLSYTYSKNVYTFNDLNFGEQFPNNTDIRHTITFAGAYTYNNLKISLGFNYKSGRPFTTPNPEQPTINNIINYHTPNTNNLPDYLRTDISANYSFKIANNKAEIGFSIWNILDRKNVINSYYVVNNNVVSKVENQSLGLTPNASFRYSF